MNKKLLQIFITLSFIFLILVSIKYGPEKELVIPHNSLNSDYVKLVVNYTENTAPTVTAGPTDGDSATTTPTNVGSAVAFSATSTDPESNDWKLLICSTSSAPTPSATTPACASDNVWCISSAWASSTEDNTCSYTALVGDDEVNEWYAFVCDNNESPLCSTSTQGTGDSGTPFYVNHRPTLTSISDAPDPLDPGATITFYATSSDADSVTSDTVQMLVCKTSGITGTTCDGGAWCDLTSAVESDPNCISTAPIIAGSYEYHVYIFDNHVFGASNNGDSSTFTVNNSVPSIGTINVGEVSLIESLTTTATSSATVSDNNGYANISSVTAVFYDSNAVAADCEADNSNCYTGISCATSSCSGNNCTADCTANPYYYANNSTDWMWQLKIIDAATASSTKTSATTTIAKLIAIEVEEETINYGTDLMVDSTSSQATTTIENTGNTNLDVGVYGTNMTCSVGSIAVGNQTFNIGGGGTALTGVSQSVNLNVPKRITTAPKGSIYWKLYVPTTSGVAGTCTGTNTFEAQDGG